MFNITIKRKKQVSTFIYTCVYECNSFYYYLVQIKFWYNKKQYFINVSVSIDSNCFEIGNSDFDPAFCIHFIPFTTKKLNKFFIDRKDPWKNERVQRIFDANDIDEDTEYGIEEVLIQDLEEGPLEIVSVDGENKENKELYNKILMLLINEEYNKVLPLFEEIYIPLLISALDTEDRNAEHLKKCLIPIEDE